MPVKKLNIEEFLDLAKTFQVFDVRSPGEYAHACIPGAISLPLFTNDERKRVGTLYKHEGRQRAIKEGLDFFGPGMRSMIESVEAATGKSKHAPEKDYRKTILLHCWRGGMRSAAVAWLLDLYGFEVYTLDGGYKAYRNWVLQQFEKQYDLTIIAGYTGTGKTSILHQLQEKGNAIVDLEGLASHKGSAFGGIGQLPQPVQEMFENLLAMALCQQQNNHFYLEDESQRIGILHIPNAFWRTMKAGGIVFLEVPFEARLKNILSEYGLFDTEKLAVAITRIQKRLGPLETKTALKFLADNRVDECFRILLSYYDKVYEKALNARENISGMLNKIPCADVDTLTNTEKLLLCGPVKS